jgi:hypothetical protein
MGRRRRSNAILMWRGVAEEEEAEEESEGEELEALSDDDAHRQSLGKVKMLLFIRTMMYV